MVWTNYEEFQVFSTMKKALKFVEQFVKEHWPKCGLYGKTSAVTGKKYTIRDYRKYLNMEPQKYELK